MNATRTTRTAFAGLLLAGIPVLFGTAGSPSPDLRTAAVAAPVPGATPTAEGGDVTWGH
ncbi:hypothetical protein ACIQBJ_07360 [Kitasatospora sp. NPDC088391]|uniref:hypothetical protein n=1 Tax=Kitasatospora sp. NPDC088391 TaxID=3364074 RepID=UPI0038289C47